MVRFFVFLYVCFFSLSSLAGCLDNKETSSTMVTGEIRGFYINSDKASGATNHYVILNKATCSAGNGSIVLASTTKSHYYLGFNGNDQMLYSMLLTAYTQKTRVGFRILSDKVGSSNKIAYILTPNNVNNQ